MYVFFIIHIMCKFYLLFHKKGMFINILFIRLYLNNSNIYFLKLDIIDHNGILIPEFLLSESSVLIFLECSLSTSSHCL